MSDATRLPLALRNALAAVRSVAAITGAGISAESGIPTYRGEGGIYDDPRRGDETVDALSGHTLRGDPDRTWNALAALASHAEGAVPNAGHEALSELERRVERFVLLTQNVDGLHRRAGSRNVIDIHGDISRTECTRCRATGTLAVSRIAKLTASPRCDSCGGILRPGVVLFGEMLPQDKVQRMQREILRQLPDLVLVVGTTGMFPYIAEPTILQRQRGGLIVEVNPEPTPIGEIATFALRGPAGRELAPLVRAIPDRSGHA